MMVAIVSFIYHTLVILISMLRYKIYAFELIIFTRKEKIKEENDKSSQIEEKVDSLIQKRCGQCMLLDT